MKNLEYRNKYLKYKNKYYNLIKNKHIKGGYVETLTIIGLILAIIASSVYVYVNKNNDSNYDNIETYNSITNKINIDINNYFDVINQIIKNRNNLNLYKNLYNFYKYQHLNIEDYYKINDNNNKSLKDFIKLFSKLKNESPILKLITPEKDDLLKDSFIYSLKYSIENNSSFDNVLKTDIIDKSYTQIRNELIDYIELQKTYDIYFTEDLDINKSNMDKNDISLAELKQKANDKKTQDNKKFIEFMKLNNDNVSDFPMIHAASDKYGIYIILLVNFTNSSYFKIYKPSNNDDKPSIKNTVVLNYSNYCNHNCDFTNNENNNNNNISKLYNINKDILNMNFEWADKDDNKYLKITEINFFNNKYNNIEPNINNISQEFNLSYKEKKKINNELKTRPWFEYYKFNYNLKPY